MKQKQNHLVKKKAFTLIELIVIMTVIGIIVLLAVPKFMGHTKEAKFTKLISNTKQLENASERYYMDKQDWPRLSDTPYTVDELAEFTRKIYDSTGKVVELDPNGKYYDIDYSSLSKYVSGYDNEVNYVIQNPVGDVFYMDDLTEKGKHRLDDGNSGEPSIPTPSPTPTPPVEVNINENVDFSREYSAEVVLAITNPTIKVASVANYKEDTYALLYTNYGLNDAGKYELIYIEKIDVENNLIYPKDFPTTITSPTNVVLYNVLSSQGVLTINQGANITTKAFDGISGGVIVIKAKELVINGTISADNSGYRGGAKITNTAKVTGGRGESILGGYNTRTQSAYYNGGGGGVYKEITGNWFVGGAGGGGSNYTSGTTGDRVGKSGGIGASALSVNTAISYNRAIFGGGGGAGSSENDQSGNGSYSGYGGAGGGIIIVYADKISGTGIISSKGQQGGPATAQLGTGGGGAGGTIILRSGDIDSTLAINVTGGTRRQMSADTTLYSGIGGNGIIYKVSIDSSVTKMSPTNATIIP